MVGAIVEELQCYIVLLEKNLQVVENNLAFGLFHESKHQNYVVASNLLIPA